MENIKPAGIQIYVAVICTPGVADFPLPSLLSFSTCMANGEFMLEADLFS